jgi:hypothetical protein
VTDHIKVRPSEGGVDVATDVVDGVHYPIYKTAIGVDGEALPVSSVDPFPVVNSKSNVILSNILEELKRINFHLALITELDVNNNEVE